MTSSTSTLISSIPKAELHCHIDGILDPAMLRELQRQGVSLPLTAEILQSAYPVQDFDDFINWYDLAGTLEIDIEKIRPILARHIHRLKAQNVVYAEIMLGSSLLPRDGVRLLEQFSALREMVISLEGGQIQIEFLIGVGRAPPPEAFDRVADCVIRLRQANLVFGVALAGWPETPIRYLGKTLARLHEMGVGIEIHAGEWAGIDSVKEALEYGKADRIGHGVALFQDAQLVERFQREQIHIEMCPTSNIKTGSVTRIEDHPIRLAREWGLNYSVNTDDPGPFEISMQSEYDLLRKTLDFQPGDFAHIFNNTLAARFQPELRYLHSEKVQL